jgi:hypothetical protein
MGPGQTCRAHQLPPSKQVIRLVFEVEVEADTHDPAAVAAIIEHIDKQVSGELQMIDADCADGINSVAYQVNAMHGRLKES